MTEENNKLATPIRIPVRKSGIESKLAQAKEQQPEAYDPAKMKNRIGLVFDDSGSMAGTPIEDAKIAVDEFLKNTNPNESAIALYPLNAEKRPLTNNFALIGLSKQILTATGGTPLFSTLNKLLDEPVNRIVAFSDGEPTDRSAYEENNLWEKCKQKEVPIDTIYIGSANTSGYETMKMIAEKTGGIFLHFTGANSLKAGLKYLTPMYRAMLMNPEVREKLEKGELK